MGGRRAEGLILRHINRIMHCLWHCAERQAERAGLVALCGRSRKHAPTLHMRGLARTPHSSCHNKREHSCRRDNGQPVLRSANRLLAILLITRTPDRSGTARLDSRAAGSHKSKVSGSFLRLIARENRSEHSHVRTCTSVDECTALL